MRKMLPTIHLLDENNSLTRAINCLTHPSSLFCILVLVCNDLVIKHQWPSWLSGKLSDFAGLYFFPFLIGLVLSIFFSRRDVHALNIGRFSIIFTAIWFILLKLSPTVNKLTSNIVETIIESPSVIVLDPSDLIAISVLIPSWYLWQSRKPTRPRWSAIPILIIASLATMGTSCIEVGRVTNLFLFDSQLYVLDHTYHQVAVSKDYGKSWESIDDPPPLVLDNLERSRNFPIVECYEDNQNICYRVNGNETIERSDDGGSSYRVVWETPPGRRYFIYRKRVPFLAICARKPDIGPYDLSLLGSSVEPIIVASAGNEGVIVGSEQSGWDRIPVIHKYSSIRPTPYFEPDPISALSISVPEVFILTFISLTYAIVISWTNLSLTIKLGIETGDLDTKATKIRNPARLSVILLLVFTLLTFLSIFVFVLLDLIFVPVVILLLIGLVVVGFLRSWYLLSKSLNEKRKLGPIPYIGLACGLMIFPLAWIPFLLWITGVLPSYQLALALSATLLLTAIYLGIWGRQKIKSVLQIEFT